MTSRVTIGWLQHTPSGRWHGFILIPGYRTLYSCCRAKMKLPADADLHLFPDSPACQKCRWAIQAFTKRHRFHGDE